jgi:hypothetical protein
MFIWFLFALTHFLNLPCALILFLLFQSQFVELVARERFELSSTAPEAAMFDHCTTGLLNRRLEPPRWNKNFSARKKGMPTLCYFCFLNVSSMQ